MAHCNSLDSLTLEGDDDWQVFRESLANVRQMAMDALERVDFERNGKSFVICDYGVGGGENTIEVSKEFVECIKEKHGATQEVIIVFEDLPQNSFTNLFTVLNSDKTGPHRYSFDYDDVFAMAVGRSFYSQCTPAGFVNFGFSQRAMQRLSKCPCTLSDSLWYMYASSELERKKFSDQAVEDWENILLQRARELAPGGQFVVGLNADSDEQDFYTDKTSSFQFFSLLSKTWKKMADIGRISEEEFRDSNVNAYYRTKKELLEPFVRPGSPVLEAGLRLVELITKQVPGPLENDRKKLESARGGGDESSRARYASRMVSMMRPWYGSALFNGLSTERSQDERATLVDEAFAMLHDTVAASPQSYALTRYLACIHIEKVKQ